MVPRKPSNVNLAWSYHSCKALSEPPPSHVMRETISGMPDFLHEAVEVVYLRVLHIFPHTKLKCEIILYKIDC